MKKRALISVFVKDGILDLAKFLVDSGWEIWEAASHLPEKQRLVFHLYYGEEYKTPEIARILRMSESAVRVNLARARTTLRKELNINGAL